MDTSTIATPAPLPDQATDPQAQQPQKTPLRRRRKRLAPMTVDTVGQPVGLAEIAALLLHLRRMQLAQKRSP